MVLECTSKQGAQQCPASRQHGWTYTGWCFWQLGNFQILKIPCLCWVHCCTTPSPLSFLLSASSLSFTFNTLRQSPPTVRPGVLTMHGGCKELIPSGQGTGKAKCLPSPQAPAGKEGQAPQNRKAGALGGGHIRDSSQEPELKSREAAFYNLHEKGQVHCLFSYIYISSHTVLDLEFTHICSLF